MSTRYCSGGIFLVISSRFHNLSAKIEKFGTYTTRTNRYCNEKILPQRLQVALPQHFRLLLVAEDEVFGHVLAVSAGGGRAAHRLRQLTKVATRVTAADTHEPVQY